MTESKELQVKNKQEVDSPVEQTRPSLVFTPDVDIFENENQITLLADMPGVFPEDVSIDLNGNQLSISGEVKPFKNANEKDVLIEFEIGRYARQFTLSEAIDQTKIEAKLKNGVLHLILPKAEKASPRKIAVAAA